MYQQDAASIRQVLSRLGNLLATEEGTILLAQLQILGLLSDQEVSQEEAPTPNHSPSRRVGIWELTTDESSRGEFVRNPSYKEEWRHWADVECIPAKGRRKRFVWIGESAARGYFFDPLCTPARMLETLCNTVLGEQQIEVIDLARVDLNLKELIPLLTSIPALEPDALIFFAGNNWDNVELKPEHFSALAAALREGGYPLCQQVFNDAIQVPACTSVLQVLVTIMQSLSIPVILLVPEFNLLEWRNEPAVQVPYLRGDKHLLWYHARQQAEDAITAGQFPEAIQAATEMLRYDEGTSAVSLTLLGTALLKSGQIREVRRKFEQARDASYGMLLSHSPRCPTVVQELLRCQAVEHGFALVDLPHLFEAYLSGELPDKRLFLDYCHMTLEGLSVTVAATANQVFALLKHKQYSLQSLLAMIDSGLTAEDEARAHFLAAIHNAHYGQRDETLAYHCQRALELSLSSSTDMLCYLDFQPRSTPHWLCDSYTQMCTSLAVQRYLSAHDGRRTDKLADFALYRAILAALERVNIGGREKFVELLKAEYCNDCSSKQDLLAYRHRARTFRERTGYALGPGCAYVKAYERHSTFYLVRTNTSSLSCQLTCRLPGMHNGQLEVIVNDRPVLILEVRGEWQTYTLTIPEEALREIENCIELIWPWPTFSADLALEQDARRLERGSFPDVLPVFGEIHAFTIC